MNTPQSMALGWGSLILAAGVSYYYARQNVNERRKLQEAAGQRPSEKLDWRAKIARQENAHVENAATSTAQPTSSIDTASSTSLAAGGQSNAS